MDSDNRPKLLFLAHTLPFPPDSGVNIRTFNILRLLARKFDITLLCFYRKAKLRSAEAVEESLSALSEIVTAEAFPIQQEHSRVRLVADHLRSVALGSVYTRFMYQSEAFERRLNELLDSTQFQLVHVDSLDLVNYLPQLRGLPTACTHQNVESRLLLRRAKNERSRLLRQYIRLQALLLERAEKYWAPRVTTNLAVSAMDADQLRQMSPEARVVVVPNGVDTRVFAPAPGPEDGLVFVGPYSWFPNREGMSYFADKILPIIRAAGQQADVTWVGRIPPDARARYTQQGVELTDYVEDIRPYVQRAACYIVPLRTGGGTRLKILDAWAMGKAVVSTSVGCEGLDVKDGENIIIRDAPEAFAAAVNDVLRDRSLRARLGDNARRTAVERYEWDVIGAGLLDEYDRAMTQAAPKGN